MYEQLTSSIIRANVRLFREKEVEKESVLVVVTDAGEEPVSVITGTFYPGNSLLQIVSIETTGKLSPGVHGWIVPRILRGMLEVFGTPMVYLYARPRPCFYLRPLPGRATKSPSKLASYWTRMLNEAGYTVDVIRSSDIIQGTASEAFERYPGLWQLVGLLEDEPLSRVYSHLKSSLLREGRDLSRSITAELLAVLARSKDLAEGTIILSHYFGHAPSLSLVPISVHSGSIAAILGSLSKSPHFLGDFGGKALPRAQGIEVNLSLIPPRPMPDSAPTIKLHRPGKKHRHRNEVEENHYRNQ